MDCATSVDRHASSEAVVAEPYGNRHRVQSARYQPAEWAPRRDLLIDVNGHGVPVPRKARDVMGGDLPGARREAPPDGEILGIQHGHSLTYATEPGSGATPRY